MPNYIRPRLPGACLFLTVTLAERGARTLVDHIEILRTAVRRTRDARPFEINAWVVLPDHMHCVWTLPEGDRDFSTRVQVIKARFSREVPMGHRRISHVVRRERGIWQRRFWSITFEMRPIIATISRIVGTIRSSTGLWNAPTSGHIRHGTATTRRVRIHAHRKREVGKVDHT